LQILLGDVMMDLPPVGNFTFSDATKYGSAPRSPWQVPYLLAGVL